MTIINCGICGAAKRDDDYCHVCGAIHLPNEGFRNAGTTRKMGSARNVRQNRYTVRCHHGVISMERAMLTFGD